MSPKIPSRSGTQPSSPGDSHASRSPTPGSDEARKMTATSGLKCLESSGSSGQLGLLERTLLGSQRWGSMYVLLTWKRKVTSGGRLLFRLAVSTPRTGATASSSLPIPTETDASPGNSQVRLFPIPTHLDSSKPVRPLCPSEIVGKHGVMLVAAIGDSMQDKPEFLWPTVRSNEMGDYQYSRGNHNKPLLALSGAVRKYPVQTALLPTPNACSCHNNGRLDEWGGTGNPFRGTPEGRMLLNPDWVEVLMGFPRGWTTISGGMETGRKGSHARFPKAMTAGLQDCDASGMPSSLSRSIPSLKPLPESNEVK